MLTHGSLFSGIGGFDLAASWMGWENVFHCEINPFGRKVLNYHFPNSISYEDITKTDFKKHRGTVDIVSGGFPCQPFSQAGKRLGTADERYLWDEMLRAITQIRPRWVVGENVRGLVNWNGGLVFDTVQSDLEAAGYEVGAFLVPACSVNAPHRRDRIWFVAHSESHGNRRKLQKMAGKNEKQQKPKKLGENNTKFRNNGNKWNAADTERERPPRKKHRETETKINTQNDTGKRWQNFPNESPLYSGNDGIPTELDGITFSKWRNESIKAYGNAVVPQVVFQFFKAIQEYELQLHAPDNGTQ